MKKQKVHYMQMLRRRCWRCNRGKLKESRKIMGLYQLGLLFWLGMEKAGGICLEAGELVRE